MKLSSLFRVRNLAGLGFAVLLATGVAGCQSASDQSSTPQNAGAATAPTATVNGRPAYAEDPASKASGGSGMPVPGTEGSAALPTTFPDGRKSYVEDPASKASGGSGMPLPTGK